MRHGFESSAYHGYRTCSLMPTCWHWTRNGKTRSADRSTAAGSLCLYLTRHSCWSPACWLIPRLPPTNSACRTTGHHASPAAKHEIASRASVPRHATVDDDGRQPKDDEKNPAHACPISVGISAKMHEQMSEPTAAWILTRHWYGKKMGADSPCPQNGRSDETSRRFLPTQWRRPAAMISW